MDLSSKQVSCDGLNWEDDFKLHSSGLIEVPRRRQTNIQQPDPLPCPRCDSKNTKFCYYNNYNKSQPRHYCKACKRHWTKGGTLRNVPIGGGRKNKRQKITSTSGNSITTKSHNRQHTQNLSLALLDQKDVFGIMPPSSSGNRGNSVNLDFSDNPSVLPFLQNQISHLTFSSLCPFQVESTPSLDRDNTLVGLSSLENTITIMPSTTCSPSQTWHHEAPLTNGDMNAPSNWNWDNVDPLVLADQLNINWDDNHEIKP